MFFVGRICEQKWKAFGCHAIVSLLRAEIRYSLNIMILKDTRVESMPLDLSTACIKGIDHGKTLEFSFFHRDKYVTGYPILLYTFDGLIALRRRKTCEFYSLLLSLDQV